MLYHGRPPRQLGAKRRLPQLPPPEQHRVPQRRQLPLLRLEPVGVSENVRVHVPRRGRNGVRPLEPFESGDPAAREPDVEGKPGVPREGELRHGAEADRRAGVAYHEHRVTRGDSRPAHPEVVTRRQRMARRVVHPVHGEVQVVARIREVVVVAPEVPHAQLRGEDEPDVVVAPVGVGRVLRPRIEPHDLHADRGIVRRSGQPLLERRDRFLVGDPCPRRAVDCAADVRDREQLLDEEPGNASLLGLGRGVEPG